MVRIRVRNTFGTRPLSARDVMFDARRAVTIPAGGELRSDRTSVHTKPGTDLVGQHARRR